MLFHVKHSRFAKPKSSLARRSAGYIPAASTPVLVLQHIQAEAGGIRILSVFVTSYPSLQVCQKRYLYSVRIRLPIIC